MGEEFEPDLNGVKYTKGYETLYSVSSSTTSITIDHRCKYIRGENDYTYAFQQCSHVLTSFSFKTNHNSSIYYNSSMCCNY